MFVEFYNVTLDKAYYACGVLDDLVGMAYTPNVFEHLVDVPGCPVAILTKVTPVIDRLTDIEPGDSFQVRLFEMDAESHVLTKRIMTHGIYWANWDRVHKQFKFERVER